MTKPPSLVKRLLLAGIFLIGCANTLAQQAAPQHQSLPVCRAMRRTDRERNWPPV